MEWRRAVPIRFAIGVSANALTRVVAAAVLLEALFEVGSGMERRALAQLVVVFAKQVE